MPGRPAQEALKAGLWQTDEPVDKARDKARDKESAVNRPPEVRLHTPGTAGAGAFHVAEEAGRVRVSAQAWRRSVRLRLAASSSASKFYIEDEDDDEDEEEPSCRRP
jgi:hypothetical protein